MIEPRPSASAPSGAIRSAPDRCPGLLRPHPAADGAMVRLRVPGGRLTAAMFAALRRGSAEFADGDIHLTSRANVQLRGLRVDVHGELEAHMVTSLRSAGFLPSPARERVRNIVASPLSGIDPSLPDVRAAVARLDSLVCAAPELAGLSGRFLFGLDGGAGDIAALGCDALAVAESGGADAGAADSGASDAGVADCATGDPGVHVRLYAGDVPGPRVRLRDAPDAMAALARRFVCIADGRWRVRELPGRGRELFADAAVRGTAAAPDAVASRAPAMPYGVLPGGAVSLLAPLGVLTPAQSAVILDAIGGSSGTGTVIVTPWRGIVVEPSSVVSPTGPDVFAGLIAAGLVADRRSAWARITACIGAPGCEKSVGDTHGAARALAAHGPPAGPVHIVGCARACGAPNTRHRLIVLGSEK